MITVVAKLKAKSGAEAKIEEAFREVLPKAREEEGTLLYNLHRAQNDPATFMVLEKYRDMDAFMHHCATPYLKDLFDVIIPLLDGDMSVDMYDEIA